MGRFAGIIYLFFYENNFLWEKNERKHEHTKNQANKNRQDSLYKKGAQLYEISPQGNMKANKRL